jgi:hypothetical protein
MKTKSSGVDIISVILCLIVLTLLNQPATAQPPLFQSNIEDPGEDLSCTFLSGGEVICASKAPFLGGILAVAHIQNGVFVSGELVNTNTIIRGNPSCTNDIGNPPQVICAVKGFNSELLVTQFNGSTWSEFQDLGGIISGDPSCTYIEIGQVLCAVKGTNSALFVTRCASREGLRGVDCSEQFERIEPSDVARFGDPTCASLEISSPTIPSVICVIKTFENTLVFTSCSPDQCTRLSMVGTGRAGTVSSSTSNPRYIGNPDCTTRPIQSRRGVSCVGRSLTHTLILVHYNLSDEARFRNKWTRDVRASPFRGFVPVPRYISDPSCAPLTDGPTQMICAAIDQRGLALFHRYREDTPPRGGGDEIAAISANLPAQGNPSCTREDGAAVVCAAVLTDGTLAIVRVLPQT